MLESSFVKSVISTDAEEIMLESSVLVRFSNFS